MSRASGSGACGPAGRSAQGSPFFDNPFFSAMPESFFSRRQVRPAPYYTVPGTSSERRLAAAKSEAIRELLARRQCRLLERLLDC